MPKSDTQRDRARLQREANLRALRKDLRLRDAFCGDGVSRRGVWNRHGFNVGREELGPVAGADLEEEETEDGAI